MLKYKNVVRDALEEVGRQLKKWGVQDHTPVEWVSILSEETGEAAREANDHDLGGMDTLEKYRMEMVQVAAVALSAIENLDRQRSG